MRSVAGPPRHYPRDIAPFSAIAEPSAQAYADLAADLPANAEARLFRPSVEPLPDGWEELDRFPLLQMVASGPSERRRHRGVVAVAWPTLRR